MRRRAMLGLIVALSVMFALPAAAMADWTPLVPPASIAGTLTLMAPPPYSTLPPSAFAGFALQLHAGESFTATLTTGPGVTGTDFRVSTDASDYFIVADSVAPSVKVLHVSGSTSETAYLMINASTSGTFTLDVSRTEPLKVSLGAMRAPKKATRRHAFWVSVALSDYDGFTSPVRFMIDRKVHGRWHGYSSAAGLDDFDHGPWRYVGKLRLPRGTFRVRARFKDAAHTNAGYNGWKTIVVR